MTAIATGAAELAACEPFGNADREIADASRAADAPQPDGVPQPDAAADASQAEGFCERQDSSYFCADFDTLGSKPTKFDAADGVGFFVDNAQFVSQPSSGRFELPASNTGKYQRTFAVIAVEEPVVSASKLAVSFSVMLDQFVGSEKAELLYVRVASSIKPFLRLDVDRVNFRALFTYAQEDGGIESIDQSFAIDKANVFHQVVVELDYVARTMTTSLDGKGKTDAVPLAGFRVGNSVEFGLSTFAPAGTPSGAKRAYYDNLLVTIAP